MGKSVYIAEKPSVAQEFAKALKLNTNDGTDILSQMKPSSPGASAIW